MPIPSASLGIGRRRCARQTTRPLRSESPNSRPLPDPANTVRPTIRGAGSRYPSPRKRQRRRPSRVLRRLRRAPGEQSVQVSLGRAGAPPAGASLAQRQEGATRPLVRFSGEGGTTTITRPRGRMTLTLTGPEISGRIAMRAARPGPFARGWRLGPAYRGEREVPTSMSLDVPVATSTLRGSVRIGGETTRLDGWRASLEHVWGSTNVYGGPWHSWDAYTVHGRGGTAWLAFGLDHSQTSTGPGAIDAQWLGVLTRVTPRGVRVCRPSVHRRRWTSGHWQSPYGQVLHARCGRLRVTLRDLPKLAPVGESVGFLFQDVHRARAGRRGAGLGRHRGFRRG